VLGPAVALQDDIYIYIKVVVCWLKIKLCEAHLRDNQAKDGRRIVFNMGSHRVSYLNYFAYVPWEV